MLLWGGIYKDLLLIYMKGIMKIVVEWLYYFHM
jgi:hypothetical protein